MTVLLITIGSQVLSIIVAIIFLSEYRRVAEKRRHLLCILGDDCALPRIWTMKLVWTYLTITALLAIAACSAFTMLYQ